MLLCIPNGWWYAWPGITAVRSPQCEACEAVGMLKFPPMFTIDLPYIKELRPLPPTPGRVAWGGERGAVNC